MQCRERRKQPGDYWPVRQCYHYPLPQGLADGTLVKLIAYAHWTVEADGVQFGPQVDSGFLYELNDRWYPADDPKVMSGRKRKRW